MLLEIFIAVKFLVSVRLKDDIEQKASFGERFSNLRFFKN